ncbi:MAG TPA: polyprenyl diphosphate synthase [Gemmatimonadaceae bacterium]|nr:polyprenyl diphosphate synthase [Gemmatimonadaceae bacterium]
MSQQSSSALAGLHVAIIMDGNGRWAQARGRPRPAGHVAGARTAKEVVEAARRAGVGTLTLYAFSGDNWKRPPMEVATLLRLFRRYLAAETARCVETGIRLSIIGRRDRLPEALLRAIEAAESATAAGTAMHLRVALDYSARDQIARAAERLRGSREPVTVDALAAALAVAGDGAEAPAVDLLVRTGGEQRLSDFLLWECAYAELWFSPRLWPDFTGADLAQAIGDFTRRERRFGAVPAAPAAARA